MNRTWCSYYMTVTAVREIKIFGSCHSAWKNLVTHCWTSHGIPGNLQIDGMSRSWSTAKYMGLVVRIAVCMASHAEDSSLFTSHTENSRYHNLRHTSYYGISWRGWGRLRKLLLFVLRLWPIMFWIGNRSTHSKMEPVISPHPFDQFSKSAET